jgi:hypothetical protein
MHCGPADLLSETPFGGDFLIEQTDRHTPQESEILRPVPFMNAGCILPKRHIQDPVQSIFNPSMCSKGSTDDRSIAGQ